VKISRKNKSGAVGFIFVTLLLDVVGLGIIIPVLPSLIMELTGEGLSVASEYGGWLLFAYAFFQFLFAPLVGALSDQFGRRPVLLTSLFGFGIDYLFLAFAPTIAWLFVGRVISGIMGASFTTGAAYIADVSPPEKRSQNFGLIGAAFGLGFIIGPVIGGLLGQYGPRVPFIAAAILSLLNWLYGYFILPESLEKDKRRKFEWKRANPLGSLLNARRYPIILGLLSALVFVYIASHAVQSTWAYYTMYKFEWDEAMVGYSLGFVGLISAIVQGGLIRVIIPKLGQKRSVYVGMVLYSIGFVLFAFASQGWMMFAFLIPYCLGGIAGPALQGIMSAEVPDNEQGELQGTMTSMMSLTSIIGPVLMTTLFAFFTKEDTPLHFPGAPLMLGCILTIIGLFFVMRTLKGFVQK
jgi:MFS transporter, DHA1 family, tetracycline resistance protein